MPRASPFFSSDEEHGKVRVELQESVYDMAFVSPIMAAGAKGLVVKAVLLLLSNAVVQGMATYFIWTKADSDRQDAVSNIFGDAGVNGTTKGVCTKVSPAMLEFLPYYTWFAEEGNFSVESTITCTQDEIMVTAMSYFRALAYGEDEWTNEHARRLSAEYRNKTGRWMNLEDVVNNIRTHKKAFGGECLDGCGFDESGTIDQDFYEGQIDNMIYPFCPVGDANLCFNIAARFDYYKHPKVHSDFFLYATDLFGAKTALREGTESDKDKILEQVRSHAPSVCYEAMREFCPKIIYGHQTAQYNRYRMRRKTLCGGLDDIELDDETYSTKLLDENDTDTIKDPDLKSVYEGSKEYNNNMTGTMSRLFIILQMMMLLLWNLAIADEVQHVVTRFMVILSLPRSKPETELTVLSQAEEVAPTETAAGGATELLPQGEDDAAETDVAETPITSLTFTEKFMGIALSLIPRTALTLAIFWAGVDFILVAASMEDVIMNSLALTFLYSIDELLFAISASRDDKKWIGTCSPVQVKCGPRCGKVHKLLPPNGVMALVVLAVVSILKWKIHHHEAHEVADAYACFCEKEGDRCMARQFMVYKDSLSQG